MNFSLDVGLCNYVMSLTLLMVFHIYFCDCNPLIKEETTTPKLYRDFGLKTPLEIMPENKTSKEGDKARYKFGPFHKSESVDPKSAFKVKSVMPGEKTLRQGDDDDDDDDDGGEYEGVDTYSQVKDRNDYCRKNPENMQQNSVGLPMMIIRQLDMVAMEIPLQKQNGQKEWSEWSACSKPCGDGVQTRWRQAPGGSTLGGGEREQQVRRCHLADCERDFPDTADFKFGAF